MSDDIKPESQRQPTRLPAGAQPCAAHEVDQEHLLDFLEGRLSAQESRSVAEHLAGCEDCAGLASQWTELDAQLSNHFKPHPVPEGFSTRLWSAIESLPPQPAEGLSEPLPLPDSQWSAAWEQYRRRLLWVQLPTALDQVGYAFAVMLAFCFVFRMLARVVSSPPQTLPANSLLTPLAYGLAFSAPVLLFALGFAAKRPLTRLLARL